MKLLVKFYWDCGRAGSLDGVFVCEKEELESLPGRSVYFGEVLGKHSEIYGELDEGDFEILTDDQDFIEKFAQLIGGSGFNPFDYIEEDEEDEEEDE